MLIRGLRIAAALAVLVLLGVGSARAVPGASAQGGTQGDVTCDSSVNAVDSLQILRDVAGLGTTAGCLADAGDVNCDGAVNSVDALRILRYVAGLTNTTPDGCAPIGDPLGPLTPQVLAARLYAATDAAQAESLLRRVYPELGVGLYTKDGEQILAGDETDLENDFYLYDFESELLVRNYVEGQLFGLDTATLFLGEAGLVDADSGQPLADADVLSMLADRVTAARADESLFTWRLIDELGLVQEEPLDLAAPGLDPATTYLDSVQTFLILYDMTLGLPVSAGASAEVSADGPKARTKALHDYSLLAQAYNFFIFGVAPTHWKHGGQNEDTDRKLELIFGFDPGEKVLQGITAGPLRNVALPPEGLVPGAVLNWFPDRTLVPGNGSMLQRSASRTTDSNGTAYDIFVPKTECLTKAGVGRVVDEVGKVQVVGRIQVTSVFPPHNALGTISRVGSFTVKVSHHTGSSSPTAGAAPAFEAAADELPPCAYEGTASATRLEDPGGYYSAATITASDLRFELKALSPFFAVYELVRGNVTFQESGTNGGCTISGGSSIPEPINDGVHSFSGSIRVDVQSGEYQASGGLVDLEGHVVWTCPGTTFSHSSGLSWIRTTDAAAPDRSFTPGGALEGSFDWGGGVGGGSGHSQWSLHPTECQPSPEPVCQ